jgi:hypothetical protein
MSDNIITGFFAIYAICVSVLVLIQNSKLKWMRIEHDLLKHSQSYLVEKCRKLDMRCAWIESELCKPETEKAK